MVSLRANIDGKIAQPTAIDRIGGLVAEVRVGIEKDENVAARVAIPCRRKFFKQFDRRREIRQPLPGGLGVVRRLQGIAASACAPHDDMTIQPLGEIVHAFQASVFFVRVDVHNGRARLDEILELAEELIGREYIEGHRARSNRTPEWQSLRRGTTKRLDASRLISRKRLPAAVPGLR